MSTKRILMTSVACVLVASGAAFANEHGKHEDVKAHCEKEHHGDAKKIEECIAEKEHTEEKGHK